MEIFGGGDLDVRGEAGDHADGLAQRSTSMASSVPTTPSRRALSWASRSSAARNPWGVWTAQSPRRSSVSVTSPSATRFTVSAMGRAQMAAPVSTVARRTPSMSAPRDEGTDGVVDEDDLRRLGNRLEAPPDRLLALGTPFDDAQGDPARQGAEHASRPRQMRGGGGDDHQVDRRGG